MIFALATDDRSLQIFADAGLAISYCEGIDVEDGLWRFWGPTGEALEAVFSEPNERSGSWVLSGVYSLLPSSGRPNLWASLADAGSLEANPYFPSLAAIRDYLAQSGDVQHHGA